MPTPRPNVRLLPPVESFEREMTTMPVVTKDVSRDLLCWWIGVGLLGVCIALLCWCVWLVLR